jgi:peptidoglycan-associated lipoprotein
MKRYGFTIAMLFASVLIVGCAKQPATMTMSSAPAPTGAAVTSPTTAMDPNSADSSAQSASRQGGADQRSAAATSGGRPAPSEFTAIGDLVDVHFDFDQYTIRSRDTAILDANARWLRANPNTQVLIEGHCDARGTEEYNLALGDRRAKAALNYLAAQGIAPERLVTISYGKERPVCNEANEACWAKNRRAHFLVKRG